MSDKESSSWASFLKSIASFNGDLSSMTAPPFILSPVSLVEYSQFWFASRELFLAAAAEPDPELRFLCVLKWFVATLRGQYSSRNEKLGSEKKPLNPFLGEVFTGVWKDEAGDDNDTVLVSEQVSHHPPVTAYAIWNDKAGVLVEGYNQIKASISTTMLSVKQYGHAKYELKALGETYLVTLPGLHIENIVFGSPYVELEGKSYIQSTTGFKAVIEYSGKGYFSGKKNSFKAKVYNGDEHSGSLYTVHGQWSGESHIKAAADSVEKPFLNAAEVNDQLVVKPIEQQHELESRRAWKAVADAITAGNYDLIHSEKSKLENDQRELRRLEKERGEEWPRMWFREQVISKDQVYVELSEQAGVTMGSAHASSSSNMTGVDVDVDQVWRFKRDLYDKGNVKP